jgi:hypothetical protein
VRESRSLGSVRGTASNGRSYRERKPKRLEKTGPFRCIIQLRESCAARAPAAVQPQLAVRPVRQAMLEVKRQWSNFTEPVSPAMSLTEELGSPSHRLSAYAFYVLRFVAEVEWLS